MTQHGTTIALAAEMFRRIHPMLLNEGDLDPDDLEALGELHCLIDTAISRAIPDPDGEPVDPGRVALLVPPIRLN